MPTILAYHDALVKRIGTLYGQFMDDVQLRRHARQNRRHKALEETSYAVLVAAIWQARDEGMTQADIVRAVGLTRERVRQICKPDYKPRRAAD